MNKTLRTTFIILLFLAIVTLWLYRPILTASSQFLKIDCELPLQQMDAIIVLGGELNGERTRKAAELYKQGVAPVIVLSDGTQMSWRTKAIDEMVALAEVLGVPRDNMLLENQSRSTYENAVYTKEMLLEQKMSSAVVVSSDWHMRRVKFIFDKVFKSSSVSLSYCGTPDFQSDFTDWWSDGEKQQTVLTEWARLAVYWLRYGI